MLRSSSKYRKTERGRETRRDGTRRYRQSAKCKARRREYSWRDEVRDNLRAMWRAYQKSDKGHETAERFRKSHRDMENARQAVQRACQRGELPRIGERVCELCGSPASHYHHYLGYAKKHRLDVIPLCTRCHGAQHTDS
jgi:hypothetical protein